MTTFSIIKSRSGQRIFGVLALLAFVFVSVGDVHIRLCLDGQDPAVTSHFENLVGYSDHLDEGQDSNDLEYELSLKLLKIKSLEVAKVFLTTTSLDVSRVDLYFQEIPLPLAEDLLPQEPEYLSLPLRAPPLLIS